MSKKKKEKTRTENYSSRHNLNKYTRVDRCSVLYAFYRYAMHISFSTDARRFETFVIANDEKT